MRAHIHRLFCIFEQLKAFHAIRVFRFMRSALGHSFFLSLEHKNILIPKISLRIRLTKTIRRNECLVDLKGILRGHAH